MTGVSDERGCIRRALILMMVSDGDVDPDELATVLRVYEKVTGNALDEAQVRAQAQEVLAAGEQLGDCSDLGEGLDEAAKLHVLAAAFAVAAADGFVVEEEDELLGKLAKDLGLSGETYRGAIDRLLAGGSLLA